MWVRISVKISRIWEFRIIMGKITGLLGCCSSSTRGSRANDYVKTLATLGFWLHHSPCSLGWLPSDHYLAITILHKLRCNTILYIPSHIQFLLITLAFDFVGCFPINPCLFYFGFTSKSRLEPQGCRNFKANLWLYRKTSSISRTKYQNLNISCILLQLSSLNPLKPGVKLIMKM